MNKPNHSSPEFAIPEPRRSQTYAPNDRVRIVTGARIGQLGTVTYANDSHTGSWVTVRIDGEGKRTVQYRASAVAKIEALF